MYVYMYMLFIVYIVYVVYRIQAAMSGTGSSSLHALRRLHEQVLGALQPHPVR